MVRWEGGEGMGMGRNQIGRINTIEISDGKEIFLLFLLSGIVIVVNSRNQSR